MSDELRARRRQSTEARFPNAVEATLSSGNSVNSVGCKNYCFCGLLSPEQTSWTRQNPGRRFHTCSRRRGEGRCAFFKWANPVMTDRAKEVILELRDRLGDKSTSSLHVPSNVEVVPEALSSLENELNMMKGKVGQLKRSLKTEKRKTLMLTCCLVISWLAFFTFCTVVVLIGWSRSGEYIDHTLRRLY